jgi:hypothetical protein
LAEVCPRLSENACQIDLSTQATVLYRLTLIPAIRKYPIPSNTNKKKILNRPTGIMEDIQQIERNTFYHPTFDLINNR